MVVMKDSLSRKLPVPTTNAETYAEIKKVKICYTRRSIMITNNSIGMILYGGLGLLKTAMIQCIWVDVKFVVGFLYRR